MSPPLFTKSCQSPHVVQNRARVANNGGLDVLVHAKFLEIKLELYFVLIARCQSQPCRHCQVCLKSQVAWICLRLQKCILASLRTQNGLKESCQSGNESGKCLSRDVMISKSSKSFSLKDYA